VNATKEARRDAQEYARAQMFYGDGAGTRRKLIQATVDSRAHRDPAYARAFHQALAVQDMAQHAKKAQIERHRKDRNATISRNVKGALSGNSKSLNASVLVIGLAVYVAHQTGYDKVVIAKAKQAYNDFKARRNRRRRNLYAVYDDVNVSN
jgi:hypothetical protein